MCFLLLHQTTLPMPDSSLSGNTLSVTIQIIGILIFLVAGAYAYRCLKTKSIGFKQTKKSLRKLQILETKPLGNRQYLLVLSSYFLLPTSYYFYLCPCEFFALYYNLCRVAPVCKRLFAGGAF